MLVAILWLLAIDMFLNNIINIYLTDSKKFFMVKYMPPKFITLEIQKF